MNLEKVFLGEQQFDDWSTQLSSNPLILNDLLFEVNHTHFQIDSMFITPDTIYFFEVKNYEGDFYINKEEWYTITGMEIKNPLLQLKKSESLLRQVFQHIPLNLPIKSYLVFMNPNFTLYNTSPDFPIILPTQLNRFKKEWNETPIHLTQKEQAIADKLLSLHLDEPHFTQRTAYNLDQIKKGIYCTHCSTFLTLEGRKLECKHCGIMEDIEKGMLRNISEFKLLFPNMKITTNAMIDWCSVIKSPKTIRRNLAKNFTRVGKGKFSYYI